MKQTGITFGNVLSYNAILEACARAAAEDSDVYALRALEARSLPPARARALARASAALAR
jgi:hypothetical protein